MYPAHDRLGEPQPVGASPFGPPSQVDLGSRTIPKWRMMSTQTAACCPLAVVAMACAGLGSAGSRIGAGSPGTLSSYPRLVS